MKKNKKIQQIATIYKTKERYALEVLRRRKRNQARLLGSPISQSKTDEAKSQAAILQAETDKSIKMVLKPKTFQKI